MGGFLRGNLNVIGNSRRHETRYRVGRSLGWVASVALAIAAVMILSTGLTSAVTTHPANAVGTGTYVKGSHSSVPAAPTASKKSKTHFTVGEGPNRAAYDPVNHDLYVPETGAQQVQVFNAKNKLVGTVPLPSESFPGQAAFDSQNDLIYVTGESSNDVYAISGTTLVATISSPLLNGPYGITFDPGDSVMGVVDQDGDNVSWILGTEVIANTPVGTEPSGIAYDPFYASILVTNQLSNNVTCINALYLDAYASVTVGIEPSGVAYDPYDDLDYVANFGSANVSAVYGDCYTVAGTISGLDGPDGVGFDQATLQMFITNTGNGKVSVVDTYSVVQTDTTSSTADPVDATYDAYNDDVYVGAFGNTLGTTMYFFT